MSDLEMLAIANMNLLAVARVLARKKNEKADKKKKYSAKWLLKREEEGLSHKLLREIQDEDTKLYKTILRMTPVQFGSILERVSPRISKTDTNFHKAIGPAERLQLTLRYLATGETQTSLQLPFRIQQSTISKILKETIPALYNALNEEELKFPQVDEDWREIAKDFYELWGFPNCIGAIDGKHCRLKSMRQFASNYWCYKGYHSFVLMAIVDAKYRFIYADIGANGRMSDAGIWMRSDLKYAIERNDVNIPEPENLPLTQSPSPFTLLADDAFPLTDYIMKPYSNKNLTADQRRFNYMLSRSRRVVENGFGILANRFQVLFTPIFREPSEAIKMVSTCVCLHNFLRNDNMRNGTSYDIISEEEADHIVQENFIGNLRDASRSRNSARQIRVNLENYFKTFNSDIILPP